jgi:hypothetical protein
VPADERDEGDVWERLRRLRVEFLELQLAEPEAVRQAREREERRATFTPHPGRPYGCLASGSSGARARLRNGWTVGTAVLSLALALASLIYSIGWA